MENIMLKKLVILLVTYGILVSVVQAKTVDYVFSFEINQDTVMYSENVINKMIHRGDTLRFWISSPGGLVASSITLYDYLIRLRKDGIIVDTYATGMCASGATIVLQAGRLRYVTPYTLFLIHGCRNGMTTGNWFKDIYNDWENRDLKRFVDSNMINLYTNRTGIPRETLKLLLSRESWLSVTDILTYGFADRLYR